MNLTDEQQHLLNALADGHTLKVHRDIDGGKVYRLYDLAGAATPIERTLVDDLIERGLLGSNLFDVLIIALDDMAYGMDRVRCTKACHRCTSCPHSQLP